MHYYYDIVFFYFNRREEDCQLNYRQHATQLPPISVHHLLINLIALNFVQYFDLDTLISHTNSTSENECFHSVTMFFFKVFYKIVTLLLIKALPHFQE